MINNKKAVELLNYINSPLSKESIGLSYVSHDITFEKCQLFSDFVNSLLKLVFDSYLGDDVMDMKNRKLHFNWCWETNIKRFRNEEINIGDEAVYEYFSDFILEMFYSVRLKDIDKISKNTINWWTYIFNYTAFKTKPDLDTLVQVYNLLNKSITV